MFLGPTKRKNHPLSHGVALRLLYTHLTLQAKIIPESRRGLSRIHDIGESATSQLG